MSPLIAAGLLLAFVVVVFSLIICWLSFAFWIGDVTRLGDTGGTFISIGGLLAALYGVLVFYFHLAP